MGLSPPVGFGMSTTMISFSPEGHVPEAKTPATMRPSAVSSGTERCPTSHTGKASGQEVLAGKALQAHLTSAAA